MKIFFLMLGMVLPLSSCTSPSAETEKAEIEVSLVCDVHGTDLAIGVDGPLMRGQHELSRFSETLGKQSIVNGQTYRTVFIGGELNNDTHCFDVVLLEFTVCDAPIDNVRKLFMDTKLRCKVNIVPEDCAKLRSSQNIPDDNLFEPGQYFLELEGEN